MNWIDNITKKTIKVDSTSKSRYVFECKKCGIKCGYYHPSRLCTKCGNRKTKTKKKGVMELEYPEVEDEYSVYGGYSNPTHCFGKRTKR